MKILDYLFPKQCLNCSKFGEYLCKSCESSHIERNTMQHCHVCKEIVGNSLVHLKCQNSTNIDGVIVCCTYNKTVERLIAELKYNFYTDIANYLLKYYIEGLAGLCKFTATSTLAPIPLHKKKQKARGFNQAELIAKKLAKSQQLQCKNLLIRNRYTETQVGMSRGERIENLKNVFETKTRNDLPEEIILIDDIMTTGTTLEECAKALKANGVRKVYGLVFARG